MKVIFETRHTGRIQRRLGNIRSIQLLSGPLETHFRQIEIKDLIGLVVDVPGSIAARGPRLAHAYLLGALPRTKNDNGT